MLRCYDFYTGIIPYVFYYYCVMNMNIQQNTSVKVLTSSLGEHSKSAKTITLIVGEPPIGV